MCARLGSDSGAARTRVPVLAHEARVADALIARADGPAELVLAPRAAGPFRDGHEAHVGDAGIVHEDDEAPDLGRGGAGEPPHDPVAQPAPASLRLREGLRRHGRRPEDAAE